MDLGSLGEWVSGLGSLAAAGVALLVSAQARTDSLHARRESLEARRAMVRDRVAETFIELIQVVDEDLINAMATAKANNWQVVAFETMEFRSPRGISLCRALNEWRELFPLTYAWYLTGMPRFEGNEMWVETVRGELSHILEQVNAADMAPLPEPAKRRWLQRRG